MYVSEKQSGTYSSPVPFGVFGENVRMADSNSLEEEFRLGGSCDTSIVESEDGNTTTITAVYPDTDYTLTTTVVEEGDDTTITQILSDKSNAVIKTKTITFEGDTIKEVVGE
jgi:hypothetical protein